VGLVLDRASPVSRSVSRGDVLEIDLEEDTIMSCSRLPSKKEAKKLMPLIGLFNRRTQRKGGGARNQNPGEFRKSQKKMIYPPGRKPE